MKRLVNGCLLLLFCFATQDSPAADGGATPRHRIAYATYLGGPEWDQAREVIVERDGSVLVGAQTNSETMPVTPGALQPKYAGDDPKLGHGGVYGGDCYLARLSPDGSQVLAATYFGGSKQERNVYGMALDKPGQRRHHHRHPLPRRSHHAGQFPAQVRRWAIRHAGSQALARLAATDLVHLRRRLTRGLPRGGLTLDGQDGVYVVGTSNSPDFPTTAG